MTVTFIAHSAYLVEWDKFYTLFDYTYEPDYTGELPELNPDKPLLVFASHSHEDHFDAKVFTLLEKYPDARFFVSRDCSAARQHPAHRRRGRGFEHPRHQVDGHRQRLPSALRGEDGLPRGRPQLVELGERGQGLLQQHDRPLPCGH